MTITTRQFKARVKAAGDAGEDDGVFVALVSVFDTVDSYGDVVVPGAFSKSLGEWAAKGDPLPVIWSHEWNDPFAHVGIVQQAQESEAGLEVRGFISPEERAENPKAAQVWRLLKARRVTQFSFAFDVEDAGFGERDGREVYELRELKLHEVGPCLLGVNQDTQLIAAKAQEIARRKGDVGDVGQLREARDMIEGILRDHDAKSASTSSQESGQAAAPDPVEPARVPDPDAGARSAEGAASKAADPASVRAQIEIELMAAMSEDTEG